jgi:hypothetical protein
MFPLRFFVLALISVACASKLDVRQTTNTNKAILSIVDSLDITMHHAGPAICESSSHQYFLGIQHYAVTLQAQHKFNDITIGEQMLGLGASFLKADIGLAKTPVSSGSTTVSPTNDDISITFSDVMQ